MAESRTRPPASRLLTALRRATTPTHRALEAMTLGDRIMDKSLLPKEYERLIRWQARAHSLLEPYAQISTPRYTYESRLPVLPEVVPHGPALEVDLSPSPATALGVAYVLEGSSLGGSQILRNLRKNPHLSAAAPFPFYAWQAERGLDQWRAYLGYTDTLSPSDAEIAEAARAAIRAFSIFSEAWQPPS